MRHFDPSQVVTLAEALVRVGFPIHLLACDQWVREHASEIFVGWTEHPTALLNAGGEPWAFCSGAQIFGFGEVRQNSQGNWWAVNSGFAVVADIQRTKHQNSDGSTWTSERVVFKLVRPA